MEIAVLGAGMVGSTMAKDLAKKYSVTVIDRNPSALQSVIEKAAVKTVVFDLQNTESYPNLLSRFDLIICAVPGFMGFNSLKAILESGKNVVDISFFPEDALLLNDLAKQKNLTAIVDCGVAPGMSNMIAGRYNEEMEVESFECMVGGLPKQRIYPFEYKAPFSPIDVIEEYTREARFRENGFLVTRPALSDPELIHFEHVGTLESFNTDGLRSLLQTLPDIPNMKEKTLRYPGHIQRIEALKMAGFFETKKINIHETEISPLEFTAAILFDQWKLQPGEPEFTLMKIIIKGKKEGKPQTIEYFLYDEYDSQTQTSSMSRCTGYTCTAAAELLLQKKITETGLLTPERVAKSAENFQFILNYLKERNVVYKKTLY